MNRRRNAGFTLLELILASAIMAVVALSLYSALRTGFKARDRAENAMGAARAAEVAMDLIRGELESALPPKGLMSLSFLGEANPDMPGTSGVEFFAIPHDVVPVESDPTTFGSVGRIQLLVRQSATGHPELVRTLSRNLLATSELPPDEEVLCRDVSGFTLRFFDGTQWHDEWDSTQFEDTVPIAVEVSLALAPPNVQPYTTTRTFYLPCRDESILAGAIQ